MECHCCSSTSQNVASEPKNSKSLENEILRKQSPKSLHTMTDITYCVCNGELANENNAESMKFVRCLCTTEKPGSSQDIIISMLQQQLKKLEELYKQHLDEHQEVRYKYCTTLQELKNLKTICGKMEEQNKTLVDKCNSSMENSETRDNQINALKNEANKWKTQYETLLQKNETNERDMKAMQELLALKTNKEPDLPEGSDNCKTSLQCKNIESALALQNENLQLILKKLEEDSQRANESRKEVMKTLNSAYDKQKNVTPLKHETVSPELLKEIESLKRENQKLNEQNQEIGALKKENESLKQQIEELQMSENKTQMIEAKDSLLEAYKKENQYLRDLLLKHKIEFDAAQSEALLESSYDTVVPGRRGVSFAVPNAGPLLPLINMATVNNNDEESITEGLINERSESGSFKQEPPTKEHHNNFDDTSVSGVEKQMNNTNYENFSISSSITELIKDNKTNNAMQTEYEKQQSDAKESVVQSYNEKVAREKALQEKMPLITKLEQLTQENTQLHDEIKTLKQKLTEIQHQLDKQKLEAEEYKKLMIMNQRAFQEISEEYNELQNTQRDTQKLDKLMQQITLLNEDNSEKENTIHDMKTRINELQQDLSKQKQQSERQAEEMQSAHLNYEKETTKQIRDLQTENKNLKGLLEKGNCKQEIGISTNNNSEAKNVNDLKELFQVLVTENKELKSALNKMCNILETKLTDLQANKTTKINTRIETSKNKTKQSCSVKNQVENETKTYANKCTESLIMKIPSCSTKCDTRWPSIFPIFIGNIEDV